jgi:hypothetical protein
MVLAAKTLDSFPVGAQNRSCTNKMAGCATAGKCLSQLNRRPRAADRVAVLHLAAS